jgi:hypothetical protein
VSDYMVIIKCTDTAGARSVTVKVNLNIIIFFNVEFV